MKKFLSVILVLAALLTPIGAVSGFADKIQDDGLKKELERVRKKGVNTVIDLDKYGRYTVKYNLLKKGGIWVRKKELPKDVHAEIEYIFGQTHVLQTISKLKCVRASVILEGNVRDFQFLHMNFYNSENKLVQSEEYIVCYKCAFMFKQYLLRIR